MIQALRDAIAVREGHVQDGHNQGLRIGLCWE